ncbi:MAG: hypothetical protein AAGJ46_12775 [Planctomycetota bacterium]
MSAPIHVRKRRPLAQVARYETASSKPTAATPKKRQPPELRQLLTGGGGACAIAAVLLGLPLAVRSLAAQTSLYLYGEPDYSWSDEYYFLYMPVMLLAGGWLVLRTLGAAARIAQAGLLAGYFSWACYSGLLMPPSLEGFATLGFFLVFGVIWFAALRTAGLRLVKRRFELTTGPNHSGPHAPLVPHFLAVAAVAALIAVLGEYASDALLSPRGQRAMDECQRGLLMAACALSVCMAVLLGVLGKNSLPLALLLLTMMGVCGLRAAGNNPDGDDALIDGSTALWFQTYDAVDPYLLNQAEPSADSEAPRAAYLAEGEEAPLEVAEAEENVEGVAADELPTSWTARLLRAAWALFIVLVSLVLGLADSAAGLIPPWIAGRLAPAFAFAFWPGAVLLLLCTGLRLFSYRLSYAGR